jgi:hypothetical protein
MNNALHFSASTAQYCKAQHFAVLVQEYGSITAWTARPTSLARHFSIFEGTPVLWGVKIFILERLFVPRRPPRGGVRMMFYDRSRTGSLHGADDNTENVWRMKRSHINGRLK